jgi:hypothetical protein
MLATFDPQGAVVAAEVDGITAAARRLAADRALTTHERIGLGGFKTEPHGLTVTGAFELHRDLPCSNPGLNKVGRPVPLGAIRQRQSDQRLRRRHSAASATSASCFAG